MIHHIFCKLVGDRNKSIIWIQDQIAYVHCTVDFIYVSADYLESHCVFTDTGTNI